MSRTSFRLLIIFATLSIMGIVITQVYWVRKAIDLREKQFTHKVNMALKEVADDLYACNNITPPNVNPVRQFSPGYYAVMINDSFGPDQLELLLTQRFQDRDVGTDFEYAIYDCTSERMVYGNYVNLDTDSLINQSGSKFPRLNRDDYYFGVYFPSKDRGLAAELGIWSFSTIVLLVVILFFGYALFIIFRQRRLSEVQKDFINNMTHEFKTPISTIGIAADVLGQENIREQPERLARYVSIVRDESLRLRNQVERVLQMARIDKDQLSLKKEALPVKELVHGAVERIQASAGSQITSLQIEACPESTQVMGDHLHLTNALYNLLDNAVKYSKDKAHITLRCKEAEGWIAISVTDQGIGIPEDQQKKIFRQFYRVPTGNLHDVKGFGLGLSYIRKLVRAHGGHISLHSQPGAGSTFTIKLKTWKAPA